MITRARQDAARAGKRRIEDVQGHRLSGATGAAAVAYEEAVRAFNLVHDDAIARFDAARAAAPGLAMAHLGKAWVLALANDPGLTSEAEALVETARALTLNEREQAHLAALSVWSRGRGPPPSRCSTAT